jgi:glycosyltransferase involved in cell wall biosynthesis
MKILHYSPVYAPAWKYGGTPVFVTNLCEGLVKAGADVTVYTSMAGVDEKDPVGPGCSVENGVSVHRFDQDFGMGIQCSGMKRAVRKNAGNFDIVHVTGIWQPTTSAACNATNQAGVPYVISAQGSLGPYSWKQKTLKKLLYYALYEKKNLRGSSGFVLASEMEAQESLKFTAGRPCQIAPNGLKLEHWQSLGPMETQNWRQTHGIPLDVPILLNAGRLHHKKGLEILPSILSRIRDQPWVMVFIGRDDDGTGAKLKKAFHQFGLTTRVFFLEQCAPAALAAAYSAANLFLLPSLHENFANVAIEALSCGCPVVLSPDVGVGSSLISSGGAKILTRHPASWADFISTALRVPSLARGNELSLWTKSRFDTLSASKLMLGFYEQILSGRSPKLGGSKLLSK